MTHITIFNLKTEIIESKLEGVITFAEVKEVISEFTKLAKDNGCYLWLTDYSEASPSLSTLEIFELPKLFSEAAATLQIYVHQIKRAIVMSKDNADYPFAKTIALNRGQSLDLFEDIEKARYWLKHE